MSNTLDVVLHRQGTGTEKHDVPVITIEYEMMFCEKHLLGYSSPKGLQRSVFLCGITLCTAWSPGTVRSCATPPDTTIYDPSVYYKYTKCIFKKNQYIFKDLNTTSKVAQAYGQVDSQHCVVKLLDSYLVKLSPGSSHFYMHPMESVPADDSKPWYRGYAGSDLVCAQ